MRSTRSTRIARQIGLQAETSFETEQTEFCMKTRSGNLTIRSLRGRSGDRISPKSSLRRMTGFEPRWHVLLLVLAVTLLSVNAGNAAQKQNSTFISHPMDLDGDYADWQDIPFTYLPDSLRVLSIAHDDESLFLMYRFANESQARQIMQRGATLWINGDNKTSKKKEEFAVRYAGSKQVHEYLENSATDRTSRSDSGESDRSRSSTGRTGIVPLPGQLTVIRLGEKDVVAEENPNGPSAAAAFYEESFVYELRIPFNEIGGKVATGDPMKSRKLAIGIQIGGLTEAEVELIKPEDSDSGSGMGGGQGGGRSGGRGGMGGGGRGGGGRGGDSGSGTGRGANGQRGPSPKIEWLSVTLPARS